MLTKEPMATVQGMGGTSPKIRMVGARELLGREGVVRIEHEGEIYTLRITRNNRLILTK